MVSKLLKNMIRVVHPGSRIRMLTFSHPGSSGQKAPNPGSRIRIRNTGCFQCDKKSRIRIFSSRIPGQNDSRISDPHQRTLTIKHKKIVSKLSEIWTSRVRIPCPDRGCRFYTHPGSRIPYPGVKNVPGPGSATKLFGNRLEQCSGSGRFWALRIQIWIRILPSTIKPWFHLLCIFMTFFQSCGTAGTITFCRSGAGTRMNYSSGSRTGFGSKSNIKWNKQFQISNGSHFLEIYAASEIGRQDTASVIFLNF
jgi:hypothetical protein